MAYMYKALAGDLRMYQVGGKTGSPGCKVSREVAPQIKPCNLRDKLCGYMINGTVSCISLDQAYWIGMVTCLTHTRSIEHFISECEVKQILILNGDHVMHAFVKYTNCVPPRLPINFYE